MGRLFLRGAWSLFLTLACAGGAVVVSAAADATGDAAARRVSKDESVPSDAAGRRVPGYDESAPSDAASRRVPGYDESAPSDAAGRRVPGCDCPAAVAPAVREFEAKCAAKTATRGDLIALKKFIAASAIDGAAKTNLTRQVRKMYQESKKK